MLALLWTLCCAWGPCADLVGAVCVVWHQNHTQVPIEVMNAMTRVPAPYLKQLAEEREIFNELPPAVKQQVRSSGHGSMRVCICVCVSPHHTHADGRADTMLC